MIRVKTFSNQKAITIECDTDQEVFLFWNSFEEFLTQQKENGFVENIKERPTQVFQN